MALKLKLKGFTKNFAFRNDDDTQNLQKELDECRKKIQKLEKTVSKLQKVGWTNQTIQSDSLCMSCGASRDGELYLLFAPIIGIIGSLESKGRQSNQS